MKSLNKLALATAVAVASSGVQAVEPLNDAQMGRVTGQAGVTIQLDTNIGIEGIEYDQSTLGAATGSFLIRDVHVGGIGNDPVAGAGSPGSQDLDLTVDIDLIGDGGFNLGDPSTGKLSGRALEKGDALIRLGSTYAGPVDAQINIGEMGLRTDVGTGVLGTADNALLFSDFEAQILLTQLDISVWNDEAFASYSDGANTGTIGINTTFALENMDVDMDVAAVSLSGVRMAGANSLSTLRGGGILSTGEYATASLTVGAGIAQYALPFTGTDVLRVYLDQFNADMYMPGIDVGGGSVGNVALDNMSITADMSLYGRP